MNDSYDDYQEPNYPDSTDLLDPASDYYIPLEQRGELRQLFLDAVARFAPEVLTRLRNEVHRLAPADRERCRRIGDSALVMWGKSCAVYEPRYYTSPTEAGDWILEAARRTLAYWDNNPGDDASAALGWAPSAAKVDPHETNYFGPPPSPRWIAALAEARAKPLQFDFENFDPERPGGWDEYAKRAGIAFRDCLKSYRQITEALLKRDHLLERAPRKLEKDHFEWLVQYQILKLSQRDLSRKHEKSVRSISSGLHTAAKLLFGERWRIWMRESPPGGRPPKRSSGKGLNR